MKVQAHRERLRAQGLRPIRIGVPDVRAAAFKSEASAVGRGGRHAHAAKDQLFIDAVSAWGDGGFRMPAKLTSTG